MAKDIQAQVQARIEAFTSDLTRLLQQAAQEAVADALSKAGAGRGRARGKAGGRRGRGPAEADLDDRLYREIKKQGGRRLEELADALGVDSKRLKLPARRLVAAKRVKKSGQARGTKYRAS